MIEKPHRRDFVSDHRAEAVAEAERVIEALATGRRPSRSPNVAQASCVLDPDRNTVNLHQQMPVAIRVRPSSMARFDQWLLATLAINLIQLFMSFPLLRDISEREPAFSQMGMSFETMFATIVGSFLFMLSLWFFASRLRSNIARWILTVMIGGTLWSNISQLIVPPALAAEMPFALRVVAMVGAVMGAIGVGFLHKPESRIWFKGEPSR